MDEARVFRAIGRRIVELRLARAVTQETLAERIGLDARDLRRLEAGANVTVRTLIHIAGALGVPLATLFEPPSAKEPRRPGRPPKAPALPAAVAANPLPVRGRSRAVAKRKPR